MLNWVRHPAKKRLESTLINQLINKTLRQSPKVTSNQMIGALISPWNLFNKRNQKYAVLLELLRHPLESYNRKNTNNVRKWDVIRGKNGQLRLDLLVPIYPKPKTITSHVSPKRKLLITFHNPTDTLCRPTQTDG